MRAAGFVWPTSALWAAWQRRRTTGRLTSLLLRTELEADYGDAWRAVGDDLDNAIAEYGEWVDGKIKKRIEGYAKEIRQANKSIKDPDAWHEMEDARLRELADEEVQYWVHGRVRRYYSAMGASAGGGVTVGRTYYLEKLTPATYDSMIDLDFGVKYENDIVQVWCE